MSPEEAESDGIKYDGEKPDYSLLPPLALDEVVKCLTFGARKYDRENWRKLDNLFSRYFAATCRHMFALLRGETHDPESGLHHGAHAICCVLFLTEDFLMGAKKDVHSD